MNGSQHHTKRINADQVAHTKPNDMKPKWKDAPTWARYLAKDADSVWYWWENIPIASFDDGEWCDGVGRVEYAKRDEPRWDMSLESKPTTK